MTSAKFGSLTSELTWYAAFHQFSLHFGLNYTCRKSVSFLIQVSGLAFWKIKPKKCVNWWQKSGVFLPIVFWIRHLGEGKKKNDFMTRCHDNDVMIAATLHWLLLAMWHANFLINSHDIGKSENQTLPKKHETRFYEWNGAFRTFGQIRVMSFRYGIQDGIHARLACITCRRLENIATNLLQFQGQKLDANPRIDSRKDSRKIPFTRIHVDSR